MIGVSSSLNTVYVWASIVGGIATGATVLFYVFRAIIRGARDAVLDYLKTQLEPNGGGSLRDAVDRTERKVDRHLADRQAHYYAPGALPD